MLNKTIVVTVAQNTWPRGTLPPAPLRGLATRQTIDIHKALLMLGTLTMPNLISPASPALGWAWIRYFISLSRSNDLRITMDFADLDPHQKGILSDDFGVAISTQYLFDRFGGLSRLVHGRQFMLQFARLLRTAPKTLPKIGPSKAPDFVLLDNNGKWHVLECKGTQSGRATRDKFLNNALSQKRVLSISGPSRGERLAAGLSISHERNRKATELRIVDPDESPLITLTENQYEEIELASHRIGVARALGSIGLSEMAVEVSLPSDVRSDDAFLASSERHRLKTPRSERIEQAVRQMKDRDLLRLRRRGRLYMGTTIRLKMPSQEELLPNGSIILKQGVNHDLIKMLSEYPTSNPDADFRSLVKDNGIQFFSDGKRTRLYCGNLFFSEVAVS